MVLPNRNKKSRGRSDLVVPAAITFIFAFIYISLRLLAVDQPSSSTSLHYLSSTRRSSSQPSLSQNTPINDMRILYIVTSSKEYNTGEKATKSGQDRLLDFVMPVVMESVESMQHTFKHVDVYMILGYKLCEERHALIENLLPINVGLEIWNDATPIGYDYITHTQKYAFLSSRDKLLARQHRYVVKDKLKYYDFFVVFEDDMLIKNHHILYHLQFMNEIQKYKQNLILEQQQQQQKQQQDSAVVEHSENEFWGSLTLKQLDHIKPGFLRVEVIKNHTEFNPDIGASSKNDHSTSANSVDPSLCCHSNHIGHQGRLVPQYPTSHDVVIWETSIDGMHVRQMPKLVQSPYKSSLLDWVVVLPIKGEPLSMNAYWSGNVPGLTSSSSGQSSESNGIYQRKKKKPSSLLNEYIGQSAGWMAKSNEVLEYNDKLCKGLSSFIPPFEGPQVADDGYSHVTDSVEFWSGGLQLWGQQCSIQRLIAIDNPISSSTSSNSLFSKHLIYHTANNKQIELPTSRFTKATTLWNQLQMVVYAAKTEQRQKQRGNSWWNYFFH